MYEELTPCTTRQYAIDKSQCTTTDEDREKAMQFFHMLKESNDYTFFMENSPPKQLEFTIKDVVYSDVGMRNIFFAANEFSKVGNNDYMLRQDEHLEKVNAFYFDIDFKDELGEHLDDVTLQHRKSEVYQKLFKMPLIPTAIIDSKNGYHIYFILDKDRICKQRWKKQEDIIFEYIKYNISRGVDERAKDITRILRVPCSYHYKSDSTKHYKITVKYLGKKYKYNEIKQAFPYVVYEEDNEKTSNNSKKTSKNSKVLQKNDKKSSKNIPKMLDDSEAINAILNLDSSYFDLEKFNVVTSHKEAIDLINSFDMRKLLNIKTKLNKPFSSILRKDSSPSCVIYKKNNTYIYYDNATGQGLTNIKIVMYIADVTFQQSMDFLADIFGVKYNKKREYKDISVIIHDNMQVLEETAKSYGFIKKIAKFYKSISEMWSKIAIEHNIKYAYDCNVLLGGQRVSEKADMDIKTARKYLYTCEALNIIERVPTPKKLRKNDEKIKDVNTYIFHALDNDKLKNDVDNLIMYCKNPLSKLSAEKLFDYQIQTEGWGIDKKTA